MVIRRFDVCLVALDPTRGHEIRKTRPCLVVSPDEMNRQLQTFLVAPLTSQLQIRSFRVPCRFQGRDGVIVLDQMRCVDRSRLLKRIGRINPATGRHVLEVLQEMFGP